MSKDERADPTKSAKPSDREERLAKALRENLRKRKKKKTGSKASSSS